MQYPLPPSSQRPHSHVAAHPAYTFPPPTYTHSSHATHPHPPVSRAHSQPQPQSSGTYGGPGHGHDDALEGSSLRIYDSFNPPQTPLTSQVKVPKVSTAFKPHTPPESSQYLLSPLVPARPRSPTPSQIYARAPVHLSSHAPIHAHSAPPPSPVLSISPSLISESPAPSNSSYGGSEVSTPPENVPHFYYTPDADLTPTYGATTSVKYGHEHGGAARAEASPYPSFADALPTFFPVPSASALTHQAPPIHLLSSSIHTAASGSGTGSTAVLHANDRLQLAVHSRGGFEKSFQGYTFPPHQPTPSLSRYSALVSRRTDGAYSAPQSHEMGPRQLPFDGASAPARSGYGGAGSGLGFGLPAMGQPTPSRVGGLTQFVGGAVGGTSSFAQERGGRSSSREIDANVGVAPPNQGVGLDGLKFVREYEKVAEVVDAQGNEIDLAPTLQPPSFEYSPVLQSWICYRRNYMNFSVSLTLPATSTVYAASSTPTSRPTPLASLSLTLSAHTSPKPGETELLQFDASRNLKKAHPVEPILVDLPFASSSVEAEVGGEEEVTETFAFTRLQFRHATGNNGKASQVQERYYLVLKVNGVVEGEGGEELELGRWTTGDIVVRGRSPKNFVKKSGGMARNAVQVVQKLKWMDC
ncbi:p53-like transcription factor [Pseudohyphozyma bogoriensis]|nr:p53-like transcription factor [Pseudohyphozyma bogoriensis]